MMHENHEGMDMKEKKKGLMKKMSKKMGMKDENYKKKYEKMMKEEEMEGEDMEEMHGVKEKRGLGKYSKKFKKLKSY